MFVLTAFRLAAFCLGTLVPVSHDLYYHGPRNGVYAYFTHGVEPYRQGGRIVLGGDSAFLPVVLLSTETSQTSTRFALQTPRKSPFCAV